MNDYREFYNFPTDWSPISLLNSTYLKGRIGWQGLKASEFTTDGPYLVTGTNFVNGRIDWEHCYHITPERFIEAPDIHLKESDLLITKDGTIGKVALVKDCPDKTTLNSGIFLLRCKDKSYSHHFLYYFLLSDYFKKYLRDTQGGSTIVHLYQREFERFTFRAPEIAQQERIAEILSTVDAAIEQTQALIEKYGRIKRGLMQDLLTRGIDENGNIRSKETHKFSVKSGIEVPDEWPVVRLVDMFSFPSGQVDPKREPYRDWYLVAPDHIESGTGRVLELRTARDQGAISGKYLFEKNDVVYSKIRPYLKKVFLANTYGLCSADMYPLRPKAGLDSTYLLNLLLAEPFTRFAIAQSSRSGFPKLNRNEFSHFRTGLPPRDEQIRISKVFTQIDTAIQGEEDALKKSHSIKRGLMRDLLSGRKRLM